MSSSVNPRGTALAELLLGVEAHGARTQEWRRQSRDLLLPVLVAAALLAVWTTTAPLAGAVVAPAQLRVEYKRKTVQHQEGGIVREILVRDGQAVHAGDALLVVGDMRQEADLNLLQDQRRAALARAARADAESRLALHFVPPEPLQREPAASEHLARESAVFAARRKALDEQTSLLEAQVQQAQAQTTAVEAQIAAIGVSDTLSEEELAINEKLASQGFVSRARLIGLQRTATDYKSRIGEARGELAVARQHIAELRSRMAQLRFTYQTQATDELKDAAARIRELDERLRPSQDQVERQVVRAPVDGDVMSMRVASAGAVIGPRDPLLDIVPRREKLVVDARIEPQDIEHVHVGGAAEVRLISDDARRTSLLPAKVTFVSADRVSQAETGKSWFDATVEVDAAALAERKPSSAQLRAGMPAEVFVTTSSRSLFEYLAKPLRSFSQRALREPG